MNAEISETITARILGLGMQILGLPAQASLFRQCATPTLSLFQQGATPTLTNTSAHNATTLLAPTFFSIFEKI